MSSSEKPGAEERSSAIHGGFPASLQRMAIKAEEGSQLRHPVEDEEWRRRLRAVQGVVDHVDAPEFTRIASHIARLIDDLDPLMTVYCGLTCPTCTDRCCDGRKVFFNRTDLIYQVALGEVSVPGQTRAQEGLECRYLGTKGCRLKRRIRPYVCVWFFCEPQVELLEQEPVRLQRRVTDTLQEIRRCRLILESLYEACPA